MNRVFILGMSHKTAPVEVREQFSLTDDERSALLAELQALPEVTGVFAMRGVRHLTVDSQEVEV